MRNPYVRDICFYIFTVLVLFGFFVSAFPSASIHAEPFAETATRFFLEYRGPLDLSYLLQKDFGYFGVVPRFLYYLLASLFGPAAFPEVAQTSTLFVMAMTIATFVFSVFSPVVPSRMLRFATVLLVASGHEYGMFLLHNLGYCFVFPVCYGLALFGITQSHRKFMILLSAVMVAFISSKGYSVVTIPALVYGAYDRLKRKDYVLAACFGAVLLLSLPQFFSVFQARDNISSAKPSLLNVIPNTFYFYVYSWRYFTFGGRTDYDGAQHAFFGTTAVLTFLWVRVLTLRGDQASFLRSSFIGSQLLALGGLGLLVLTFASKPLDFFHFPNFILDSYFFCSKVSIVFAMGLILSWYAQKVSSKFIQMILLAVILTRAGVVNYTVSHIRGQQDPYGNAERSASNWNTYFPLYLSGELPTIPINPPGWFLGSLAKPVSEMGTVHADTNTITLNKNVAAGIKGVCVFNLKEAIHHLEVRSKSSIFTANGFRTEDTKYPCFKWPPALTDLSDLTINVPLIQANINDAKISFLY